jgi:hypothetical protein
LQVYGTGYALDIAADTAGTDAAEAEAAMINR